MRKHGRRQRVCTREGTSCVAYRRCAGTAGVALFPQLVSGKNCSRSLSIISCSNLAFASTSAPPSSAAYVNRSPRPRTAHLLARHTRPSQSAAKPTGSRFHCLCRAALLLLIFMFGFSLPPVALGQKLSDDGKFYCSMPNNNLAVSFCGGDYPSRTFYGLPTVNNCDNLIRYTCRAWNSRRPIVRLCLSHSACFCYNICNCLSVLVMLVSGTRRWTKVHLLRRKRWLSCTGAARSSARYFCVLYFIPAFPLFLSALVSFTHHLPPLQGMICAAVFPVCELSSMSVPSTFFICILASTSSSPLLTRSRYSFPVCRYTCRECVATCRDKVMHASCPANLLPPHMIIDNSSASAFSFSVHGHFLAL
jgi:hypothetical protein